jgi:hypothetical protein
MLVGDRLTVSIFGRKDGSTLLPYVVSTAPISIYFCVHFTNSKYWANGKGQVILIICTIRPSGHWCRMVV